MSPAGKNAMALTFTFTCPLPNGLHARPASHLAALAGRFHAHVTLANLRSGTEADAASVLDLVSAGVLHEDPCRLTVKGKDQAKALAALTGFIQDTLPHCDAPLPPSSATGPGKLPRLLEDSVTDWLAGAGVSPGIGLGWLVRAQQLVLPASLSQRVPEAPEAELAALDGALSAVTEGLEAEQRQAGGATAVDILTALLAMLKDPALAQQMRGLVLQERRGAAQAVAAVVTQYAAKLRASGSAYLSERAADLEDLGLRLLARIGNVDLAPLQLELTRPSIVAARNLSPSQFLALDRTWLRGLVLGDTGATAHVVILARSFGIPAVTGVQAAGALPVDQECLVDGGRGLVLTPLPAAARRFYEREQERDQLRQARWAATAEAPAQTADGFRLEVAANIASEVEVAAALARGAEGVGLFRTEMLYTGRATPPSEDEQFAIYRTAVEALDGRPVIIRTLDVGGDKPLPYLDLRPEANPFLGYRGIRMYQDHPQLIDAQLRAIVRASAYGPVKVMAPMVSTVDEARWFRERVLAVQAGLAEQSTAFDPALPVGIMLEVPAAALAVIQLSAVVDFFSIGTNDLCQYTLAVDRGNPQVAGLFSERQPAFLRLLKLAVDASHRQGKWIGLCGEMARRPANLPLLLGLGLDEISLSAPAIPAVKSAIRDLDWAQCRQLLEAALACATTQEVDQLLAAAGPASSATTLVAPELINLDSASRSKAEAIKELTDLLYVAGRCDAPDEVEDAVWAREETYSTGLGFGIAIPHCKSSQVLADTLGVLRLKQPVEWGSLDGKPVELVLLLAIREPSAGNRHLKILALLARKLMHEEFRQALSRAQSSAELVALLDRELELNGEEV